MGTRLAVAGGGTGGHVFPALAVIEELLDVIPREDILFLGAEGGLEEKIVPRHNLNLVLLPSIKGLIGPRFPLKALHGLKGYFQARKELARFGARAVLGVGGYASALPVMAARGLTIPALLLEQNAIPGRTNRFLSRFVWEVGCQFGEAAAHFPQPRKARVVGNPLRRDLRRCAEGVCARRQDEPPGRRLLILGGSQGAHALNQMLLHCLMDLKSRLPEVEVYLISGPRDEAAATEAMAKARVHGKVVGFTEDMALFYSAADLVLCRSGATTLAELATFGLPSVLVPYPHATDNHQEANARIYERAGASRVVLERDLTPASLSMLLAGLLSDPDRLRAMGSAARQLDRPDACRDVARRLTLLAGAEGLPWPGSSLASTAKLGVWN